MFFVAYEKHLLQLIYESYEEVLWIDMRGLIGAYLVFEGTAVYRTVFTAAGKIVGRII